MLRLKMNQFEIDKLVKTFIFEEMATYTPNSKKAHRTTINNFFSIIDNYDSGFTTRDILYYMNSPQFDTLKPTTQNLYKRHLKKFFRWYGIEEDFYLRKCKISFNGSRYYCLYPTSFSKT